MFLKENCVRLLLKFLPLNIKSCRHFASFMSVYILIKECPEFRLQFWDTVKDKYKVDMSALKPFALNCLTDHVHVLPVNGEDVMARPAEICSYSLSSAELSQLLHIKVNH